jgi:hypothetical protein
MAVRVWGGGEAPSELESSGDDDVEEDEDEEVGEITPSPHSPPPEDVPSLGDLFSQQTGIFFGARQTKHSWMGAGGSSGSPPQSGLTLVYSVMHGMIVCTGGGRNNSLNRGFVGSLTGHRGYCLRDDGGILVGHLHSNGLLHALISPIFFFCSSCLTKAWMCQCYWRR